MGLKDGDTLVHSVGPRTQAFIGVMCMHTHIYREKETETESEKYLERKGKGEEDRESERQTDTETHRRENYHFSACRNPFSSLFETGRPKT